MPSATRKEFRTLVSLEEARAIARRLTPPQRVERVPLAAALDRVLAEDVVAARDVPPFTRSLMDGYAVRSRDTLEADEERPCALRLSGLAEAGRPAHARVEPVGAVEVATGALLPEGANAVVPVEHADRRGDDVLVRRGVTVGENVMSAGDDLMLGDLVLPAGTRLGPAQLGALAATGEAHASVWARPRVGIASVGDEVVAGGVALEPGQIHDINGIFLAAAVARAGGEPVPLGILADERAAIEKALEEAAGRCDLLLTSGSTSAGAGDVVYRILEDGGGLLAHGIRLEPGKPTVLARFRGTPCIALPGNPASAAVVFEALVAPLVRAAAGVVAGPRQARLSATLASGIRSAPGRRLLRMVGIVEGAEGRRAYPIEKRSGAITLLSQADGFVDVPEDVGRLEPGEAVEVVLLEDREALPDLLFVGSHCLGLRPLFRTLEPLRARSLHVGSLGGVRAVARGVADVAGMHLRERGADPNAAALQRMGVAGAVLVRGYRRRQGWIVAPGNPLGIRGLADLLDRGLRVVNRVGGSGTRALMDEIVQQEAEGRGASASALASSLPGYEIEAASHSAVAAAVRAAHADAGLGIEAAAALQGLSFVPVADEAYDFLVRVPVLESERGRALLAALTAATFRAELERLPGYRALADAGCVVWP
ncbi:MAG: molybdopterin biosynthesis protein [Gemmatimonadota bacterium]